MRPDMHEVIIERPRWGHSARYPRRRLRNRFRDEGPSREAMSEGGRDKHLNENLAPLLRFLHSRVGRPWSKVRSELSENLRVTSAVQKHVMDHVKDFVIETTWRDDEGRLWGAGRSGRPGPIDGTYRYRSFYVEPKTGLLAMEPLLGWRARKKKRERPNPHVRELSPSRQLRRIDGLWFSVTIAPMPTVAGPGGGLRGVPVWDAVGRRVVQRYTASWTDRDPMAALWWEGRYAQSCRQLSKKEIRTLVTSANGPPKARPR